ncbi:MAG: multicopper oxidase domain-containing protein [Candidatus Saccharibacteria bacterium]|nr:multicopper oxidase domain-containing protein [Pseudorhodobacter sp.]
MHCALSRRNLLITATATAALLGILGFPATAAPAAHPSRLIVDRRTIEVDGRAASVFGIHQPDGVAGTVLGPDQPFSVNVANRSGDATIVHWHGQTPPFLQDGVAETGGSVIETGAEQAYNFVARPGTHWMHSHHGLHEQALMAVPLIVRTAEDLRGDMQEVTVLLNDFSFREPAEVLAAITGPTKAAGGPASMPGMVMTPSTAAPDLNDFDYDAYLANDRTLDDPLVVRAAGGTRVRLRLINGATSTAFWIDTGAFDGTVIVADGSMVQPVSDRRFPLAQGQRLDVVVTIPKDGGAFPILAQREGDRRRTGIVLASAGVAIGKLSGTADTIVPAIDNSLERRLLALAPLVGSPAGITHKVALTGSMMPYIWSIDDRTWTNHVPLRVAKGRRVVIEMTNRGQMAHPMHPHGHHFQVVALDGAPLLGAVRDTVFVPAKGSVIVAFDADNPGRWLFHCHNLFHMATGMMTELVYDDVA